MAINTKKAYIFNLFCKLMPPTRCRKTKVRLLRWCGAKVGKNVSLFTPKILGNFDLIIEDDCWIGYEAMLMGPVGSKIVMKRGAKLGTRAILVTGYHTEHIEDHYNYEGSDGISGDITLERCAAVGTMSMVCPGITVRVRGHVTACSIVRHNVPPYAMVMGNPAKVVGYTFTPEEIIEYEATTYSEEDRVDPELLRRNYRKYFIDRRKEIREYLKQ